ncbi:MAG TPA: MBL fold metallo-hydrolase [Candidatus Limiplasma sp.]|nr:MBL fold metallo-hydrolase [Candidatus Limiplasma sp.]HRX09174.1 MBL fold metallo-hydrolase [Candidatus Limiplasma sp.]
MKIGLALIAAAMLLGTASAAMAEGVPQPTLTLIGHAHLMIVTAEGTTIYIDPSEIKGYSYERDADIILVSHEHGDHNQISLVPQADDCQILRVKQTINKDGSYNSFTIGEVTVIPVPAANKNHKSKDTNGLIIQFDGITVYFAADTGKLDSMADLRQYNVDYAFFPIDGKYNMNAAEAMECAVLVGARHNTPIHWFDADPAKFTPENLLFMNYGDTILLETEQND